MSVRSRHPLQMPDHEWRALAAARGVPAELPAAARALGCHGCKIAERVHHPEWGVMWCAVCPVTARARKRGDSR